MSLSILGLGTAVPEHSMLQSEALQMAHDFCCSTERQARLTKALYNRAGVDNRYTVLPYRIVYEWMKEGSGDDGSSVDPLGPTTHQRMQFYEEHAFPLALRAVCGAIEDASIDAREMTHLVTVSCTGFSAPGVDIALMTELGLSPTIQRVHVGFMGCHGSINAMRVAQAIGEADRAACILLCAVELCSLHVRFQWDPERFLGNALFADGAAALVLRSDASCDAWSVSATGSCLLPESQDAMSWRIGDHGYEMTLSPRVSELIHEHLRPWLSEWLKRQGTNLDEIGCWAVHPGGPKILKAVESCLELSPDATAVSHEILAKHGNMSSPTVLFILDELRKKGASPPCVVLGFGPGLVAEVALLS